METVCEPRTDRPVFVKNEKDLRALVMRAFPGWDIIKIHQAQRQNGDWYECDHPFTSSGVQVLANEGAAKICVMLTHDNGGEVGADYYIEELFEPFEWKPLDRLTIHANQGERDAYVLAVIGDEALIEYDMPRGTTALWVIHAHYPDGRKIRNISYRQCPQKWLDAIEEAGTQWEGRPQQGGTLSRPA